MDAATFLLMAFLIFGVSFIYSNLGLGGGLLYVPILLTVAVADHRVAAPISLMLAAATGLSSWFNHWRKGLSDNQMGLILLFGAIIGSYLGVQFTMVSSRQQFTLLFLTVLLVFGAKMLYDWYRKPATLDTDDDSKLTRIRLAGSSFANVGAGFFSGALGVGGGLYNVPLLVYGLARSTRKAIGTSAMIIVPTAIFGFFAYAASSTSIPPDFWLIPALFPLVLVGAFVGSRWGLAKLKTRTVSLIFILMLFVAATKLVWDLLSF